MQARCIAGHTSACACICAQPLDHALTLHCPRPVLSPACHCCLSCQSLTMRGARRAMRFACAEGADGPERCTGTPCKHTWEHQARPLSPPPVPISATITPQRTYWHQIPLGGRGKRGSAAAAGWGHPAQRCTLHQAATTGGVPANCSLQPKKPCNTMTSFCINSAASDTEELPAPKSL